MQHVIMQDSSTLTKSADADPADASLISAEDVLRGMLAASNDACWCMEFRPPVDLTADDQSVVQQIFANGPVWRNCNAAMERLYHLPAGQSLDARPVHEIFPNNSSNREFLLNLIAKGFEVDGAPALDRRYDGLEIYVENDVRAHISNGKLYRMFGTVRDISKHRRREQALTTQLGVMDAMVAALPSPIIAVDALGAIEVLNPAAAVWLGQGGSDLAGQSFEAAVGVVLGDKALSELLKVTARVRSLGSPMTAHFGGVGAPSVWQIAPRETTGGTGLVILILTDDVMEL
jgi:PAS domain-containing protein